jgi:sugar lactone lactonase YvrE
MKTKRIPPNWPVWLAAALLGCALRLPAQTAPIITTQPAGQTNLAGTTASFTVAVSGTGPFTYQWQFNGTNLPIGIITTMAGNGSQGYSGDGTAATSASVNNPYGLAVDADNNLYVADSANNRIRRVNTNGVITTVAGYGSGTYAGDGGAATNASLRSPQGVAVDTMGNLYIADTGDNRIRKVDTNGVITTVAGNGTGTYAGDGSAATNASLFSPYALAWDAAGNMYVADAGNNRIRKVDTNGVITTVAGNGVGTYAGDGGAATNASLYSPQGVAVDAAGNLDVADTYNNVVRQVNPTGVITTVAGNGTGSYSGDGGAATNANLDYPAEIALDASNNLYIADFYNNRIREVTTNGLITTLAGDGSSGFSGDGGAATNAALFYPTGVAFDTSGNLDLASSGDGYIRKVYLGGSPTLTLNNVGVANAGNYTVVITNAYGSVTSAPAALTVYLPTVIQTQPAAQTVLVGSNATFSVTATGPQSLYYSWYLAGTNLLQSGTNNLLSLSGVTMNNAGNYTVVITNAFLSITSAPAALTVVPAIITAQPTNQVAALGGSPVFSVTVTGPGPLGYWWYLNSTNLVQSGPGSTLTLPGVAVNQAGTYQVLITNSYGSVTSQVAILTLKLPPTVVAQPVSLTNLPGATVTFQVTPGGASAGPFAYQWQFNGTNLPNGIITSVAGNGNQGNSGDGGVATNASFNNPQGVAVDGVGNLYIADTSNNRIRKVGVNGLISTMAGGGSSGLGDGGPAASASLSGPTGVAVDAFGNLYIADDGHGRIRMVATNEMISTFAGNGTQTYAGDGGAATNASLDDPQGVDLDAYGNLYIADTGNQLIREVTTNGLITTVAGGGSSGLGDGGPATLAGLNYPAGVALDAAGNLYIADKSNYRIRKVATNGVISTVAGKANGSFAGDGGPATNATLALPSGVAFDAFGNLYIADEYDNRIRLVNPNGIITTVAGDGGGGGFFGNGGVATNASLYYPAGVALDASGNLYIADKQNQRIRKVWLYAGYPTLTLGPITVYNAGTYSLVITNAYGSVTSSVVTLTVAAPPAITLQPTNQTVALGASPGLSVAVAGSGPFGYEWYLDGTNEVQSGTNNSLTVTNISPANAGPYTVVITNSFGSVTSQVAAVTLTLPPTVAVPPVSQTNVLGTTATFSVTPGLTSAGPFTYQWQFNGTNLPNGLITTVAGNGTAAYAGDGGQATNASLYYPSGVALDAAGNFYVADTDNHRIRKVTANGLITTVAGNGTGTYAGDGGTATNASLYYPAGVAADAFGNFYIADQYNHRIRLVTTNGLITTIAGNGSPGYAGDGGAATNASLYYPAGVALDAAGNLYIADKNNERVRRVATNGIITTVAGKGTAAYAGDGGVATNASLYYPNGVALDTFGNLFIADYQNSRIRLVTTNGLITTVAGKSSSGYSGDGGAATNATLDYPSDVAVDGYGNLYIADYQDNRIRLVTTNGLITTVAGKSNSGYSGDGGAATNASLYYPNGVAVDAAGNLYISDKDNERIRKVVLDDVYPTLTLGPVTAANAGNYSVVISNSYGSITSVVATLTVAFPPAITTQPAGQLALIGTSPAFSVAVTGTPPFNYSWYFNSTNLMQSGTNNTFTLSDISTNNAGLYSVVVTNAYGGVTSQPASLTLAFPPTVAIPPAGQTNLAGTAASFTVTPGGTGPFAYQWQFNGTNLPNNLITTVAGIGYSGFSGDGGAATNARLSSPDGVAFDAAGNLYISDFLNNRIRKVSTNGLITTVAGNAGNGYAYSGDGGPATNASMVHPGGVALDAAGNLYIADTGNNRIRRVGTNGIITTVAGNGPSFPSPGSYAGDGGTATNASLYSPEGVALDPFGNLYIADSGNNRIRLVSSYGLITTVAGKSGSGYSGDGGVATNASLYDPVGVSLDAAGNLYIADANNNRIRKLGTNGLITTVAGNGPSYPSHGSYAGDGGAATNASLYFPAGVSLDPFGNLYIADTDNNRIRLVSTNDLITTVAGNGPSYPSHGSYAGDGGAATNAYLWSPNGVALDAAGNLDIADDNNNCIREVHFAGFPALTLTTVTVTNAGNYSIVIASPYGSVTSAVVNLTVTIPTTPPQIIASGTSFGFLTNQFGFNLNGAYGQTIIVDGSTNLLDWTPLFTNTANGAPFYFFDPAWTNFPWRFYRARLPAAP